MFKFRHHTLIVAAAFCVMIAGVSSAFGASDTQNNTVTVNSVLTVTAPAGGTMTHDGTDGNQALTPADWTVAANAASGSSISFAVSAPFVHETDTTYKRDVKLDLSVNSSDAGSGWVTSVATGQTDHGASSNSATVTAASTAAGNASLTLGVTMVSTDYSTMAAGNYATTVTATLAAN